MAHRGCRNVEIQVIITPSPPLLQGKFNEANHDGLFVRNLQVKFPIVVAEIPGIQIAVPRRGHIAECVGQPHHRQENDFPLKTKMERYRRPRTQAVAPKMDTYGGRKHEGHVTAPQDVNVEG